MSRINVTSRLASNKYCAKQTNAEESVCGSWKLEDSYSYNTLSDVITPETCVYSELCVAQGLELEYGELREYTHGMFANMAEVLGPDFAPYLPHVVPPAIAACTEVCCWHRIFDSKLDVLKSETYL